MVPIQIQALKNKAMGDAQLGEDYGTTIYSAAMAASSDTAQVLAQLIVLRCSATICRTWGTHLPHWGLHPMQLKKPAAVHTP